MEMDKKWGHHTPILIVQPTTLKPQRSLSQKQVQDTNTPWNFKQHSWGKLVGIL